MRAVSLLLIAGALVSGCDTPSRGSPGGRGGRGGSGGGDGGRPADSGSVLDGGAMDATDRSDGGGMNMRADVMPRMDAEIPPPDSGGGDAGVMPIVVRSIAAIQDPSHPDHPAQTELCYRDATGLNGVCPQVELQNVMVTASSGFLTRTLRAIWVQDPNDRDGRFAGIKITFVPDRTPYVPVAGELINVSGNVVIHYSSTQIEFATFTAVSAAPAIAPTFVQPGSISRSNPASHAYEGSLVRIDNATVVQSCVEDTMGRDHGEWIVTGDVKIGYAFEYTYNGMLRPATVECFDGSMNPTGLCGCSVPGTGTARPNDMRRTGDRFISLTGVVDFTFGEFVLQPRSEFDLVR